MQPGLPAGVLVDVVPSVVDELVVSNATAAPLEVIGLDGRPFLSVSRTGVLANLASPDWYATGTPEGGPIGGTLGAAPRWARVSRGSTWSEFDSRLRPAVTVPAGIRAAGKDRILTAWQIPLRYAGRPLSVVGHIAFRPVRGGLVVAVTSSAVAATPLQGELPGLFVRAPQGKEVVVQGRDGLPFLRFSGGAVLANTASLSWRDDRTARGLAAPVRGWVKVGTGLTFSWLDGRLRYARDVPPHPERPAVVKRWTVPLTVAGVPSAVQGTVTWVPRRLAFREDNRVGAGPAWWVYVVPLLMVSLLSVLAARSRRRTATRGQSRPKGGPART